MTISLDDIRSAAAALAGDLTVTPTIPSPRLSEQTGCRIHLKLECLHHTGSFKERGALNKLKSLSTAEAAQGVIAMSAGNHAQGVAYHATRLGIPATIVMPAQTPFTKVERTESLRCSRPPSWRDAERCRSLCPWHRRPRQTHLRPPL